MPPMQFPMLSCGSRGAIVDLPIFADGVVETLVLQVSARPSIMRSCATASDVDDFEAHLSVSGSYCKAPEIEQAVALLALWMESFVRCSVSPAALNAVSRQRVNELIKSVATYMPRMVTEPGSWNLPGRTIASTGRLGHALFYADIPLDRSALGDELYAALVAQAGDQILTAPGSAPFSLADAVAGLNRYQAARWASENVAFARRFAERLAAYPSDLLYPLLALAIQRETVVAVRAGGKIVDDEFRPSAARMVLRNLASHIPGALSTVPNVLAIANHDTLAQQWLDGVARRGRRQHEDILDVVHTLALLAGKPPATTQREFLELLLQGNPATGVGFPRPSTPVVGQLLTALREHGFKWDDLSPKDCGYSAPRVVDHLERLFGTSVAQQYRAESVAQEMRQRLAKRGQAGEERLERVAARPRRSVRI